MNSSAVYHNCKYLKYNIQNMNDKIWQKYRNMEAEQNCYFAQFISKNEYTK